MNIYKKGQVFVLLISVNLTYGQSPDVARVESEELDLMSDFAYPVSTMQMIRQNLSQALYFLQQNHGPEAASLLSQALSMLMTRQPIEPDDYAYMQQMIQQIDDLITTLENLDEDDKSQISDACDQLQRRLS